MTVLITPAARKCVLLHRTLVVLRVIGDENSDMLIKLVELGREKP